MFKCATSPAEAHHSRSATAIDNASRGREHLCLESRRLRTLENVLPPEFETQFRTISDPAGILTENARDGWLVLGAAPGPSGEVMTHSHGSDQSLDGSLTDPTPLVVDNWTLVTFGMGGGPSGKPSINVRLKDLKLNFTLCKPLSSMSSADQGDNLRSHIIKIPA